MNDQGNITGKYDYPQFDPMHMVVLGTPRPQGSMSAIPRKGGGVFMKAPSTTTDWRNTVIARIQQELHVGHLQKVEAGPIAVSLGFFFARPKSHPQRRRKVDRGRRYNGPDLDKLVRAMLDGMTIGGLIGDDTQVARITAEKTYSEDGSEGVEFAVLWMAGGYRT